MKGFAVAALNEVQMLQPRGNVSNKRSRILQDWPWKGDSLLGAGAWATESVLGCYIGGGFYEYASAYKQAADTLVENVLAFRLTADVVALSISAKV